MGERTCYLEFCPQCDAELAPDHERCPDCGRTLDNT
ncbi:MAG: zinc-ribbon domain-containing protein [Halobacteriales archaeon]